MNIDQMVPMDGVGVADDFSTVRMPYSNPQLLVYGALSTLTSGGSVGVPENAMMTAMTKHP